ncbi:hypothetical protein GOP47_0009176, partial [Adiantum capillus-veneris]
SNLARGIFREFNEMDHLFNQRLNSSYKHAPAFLDESLLEARLLGSNLLWFAVVFGTITAISRSAVIEEFQVVNLRDIKSLFHASLTVCQNIGEAQRTKIQFGLNLSLFQYTGMIVFSFSFFQWCMSNLKRSSGKFWTPLETSFFLSRLCHPEFWRAFGTKHLILASLFFSCSTRTLTVFFFLKASMSGCILYGVTAIMTGCA